jgi:hypothetical protein
MKAYDKVTAVFQPRDLASLKSEGHADIGKAGTFVASWVIEEGQFKGQWAMAPDHKDWERFSFAWCPEEDLQIQPSKNPVDVIRDVVEPIARDRGLELDEEALKKAREFCEGESRTKKK